MKILKFLGNLTLGLSPTISSQYTSKANQPQGNDDPESVLYESHSTSLSDTAVGLTLDTVITRRPPQVEAIPDDTQLNSPQAAVINNAAQILELKIPQNERPVDTAARLQRKLERFTEVYTVNEQLFSKLDPSELKTRTDFVIALIQHLPAISADIKLEEEYDGYRRYANSPFKDLADKFVQSSSDKSTDTFATRGNIAEYLEHRDKQDDRKSALTFIQDLATLSNIHHVKGTGELLRVALKHEREHVDDSSNAHGFYRHAKSALALAELRPKSLQILEVAVEEFQRDDHTYSVPRNVGDIDILAREEGQDLFIEVKTSIHAATSNRRQLNSLIEFSKRQNAIPVLMIGNINNQLRLAQQTSTTDVLIKNAKENMTSLGRIVEEQDGNLQIWDRAGKDVTYTVRDLYRSLAMKDLLTHYQHA